MKEFPEWKIAIAEGVKIVRRIGSGQYKKAVRVKTTDKSTGVEVLNVIRQNMSLIAPGFYEKITGVASNCRDFTVHFSCSQEAWDFYNAINDMKNEYGDYTNYRGDYAITDTETDANESNNDDSNNKLIIIIGVVFLAAIGFYIWKRAR